MLRSLLQYSRGANGKYLILTGSAGNGKTNLLCSISELLVNLKQTTIFLNAREIEGDILDFVFDEWEFQIYIRSIKKFIFIW